jgi:hypothetical protein
MSPERIAIATLLLAATGTSAFAGLSDGIHPGPAPSAWLLPARAKAPAYALAGSTTPARAKRTADGFTHEVRRIGTKVVVDVFVR